MPKKRLHQKQGGSGAYLPDFTVEPDLDYTTPYPCGVCGGKFNSRSTLATHSHAKRQK
jgi:hypothetical protein